MPQFASEEAFNLCCIVWGAQLGRRGRIKRLAPTGWGEDGALAIVIVFGRPSRHESSLVPASRQCQPSPMELVCPFSAKKKTCTHDNDLTPLPCIVQWAWQAVTGASAVDNLFIKCPHGALCDEKLRQIARARGRAKEFASQSWRLRPSFSIPIVLLHF